MATLPHSEMFTLRLVTLLICLCAKPAFSSTDSCEKRDGDCPASCVDAGFNGTNSFTALLHVSPAPFRMIEKVEKAESAIRKAGHVQSTDNPIFALHTSLFYFCCYTKEEQEDIEKALHTMKWSPITVNYNDVACNLDHNNKTVYIHALPTVQDNLFALSRKIEDTVASTGAHIERRETLFHMTFARVPPSYPTDDVVRKLSKEYQPKGGFGSVTFNKFNIGMKWFHASGASSDDRAESASNSTIELIV
eukprot:TRINITY_DN2158_c0_g4_i1.p1 TRINITY_DN2158_c0_g4~~TRINITY_DN2158_c0_g4_i1.p1  ORF type:complete len:283 (-),score=55.40 TRINITY_DN2158_c0_g4_i1:55-801(-)